MIRWSSRLRRAASLLLGVHLLQVVLVAASAVCEVVPGDSRGAAGHLAAVTAQTATAPVAAAHAAHHAPVVNAVTLVATAHLTDGPPPAEHSHHAPVSGGSCPMAMACTVAAVLAPVPVLETGETAVAVPRITQLVSAPLSVRHAPEPPPPRA